MAAAICRILSLPDGCLRTTKIRTTAKATAASPPATPNQAVFGSTNPPSTSRSKKKRRRDRLKEPEIHHRGAGSPGELEAVEAACRLRPPCLDPIDPRLPRPALDGMF